MTHRKTTAIADRDGMLRLELHESNPTRRLHHVNVRTQSTYRSQLRINFPTRGRWAIRLTGSQPGNERHVNIPNVSNVVEILND